MKPAIYYILRVKLIRYIKNGEINFINDEKEFKDENPINAREKAIRYYQNYIDTIVGENIKHSEVVKEISKRISRQEIEIDNKKFEFEDFVSGIGVFLKIENPINDDKKGDEFLIHGVGFNSSNEQSLMDNLNNEILYYKYYKYKTGNHLTDIEFYEADIDDTDIETILKTPNDWKNNHINLINFYNKKQSQAFAEENRTTNEDLIKILRNKINEGENNKVEFKASLVSFINNDNEIGYSKYIRFKIVKTIASFLNSNGGLLFIGVKDDKTILGLHSDFSLSNKENKKDYFRLEVDRIIKEYFKSSASLIEGNFIEIENKTIYFFLIHPSKKPIFINDNVNKNNEKDFYIRLTGASSILINNIDEIIDYCMTNWCNK